MGKTKHKHNTRSTSGQIKNKNNSQETEENSNFTHMVSNTRNETKASSFMEEVNRVPSVPGHITKKRVLETLQLTKQK